MTDRRLDRRDFLRLGLVAGPAALVASCGWDGGPAIESRLRSFSRVNDWIGEKLTSGNRLAREYAVTERTRDFPTYFVSRTVPVLPDPDRWTLEVHGEVKKPTQLSLAMLRLLPRVTYTVKHHCVEGWTAIGSWSGVPFASVAAMVEPTARARYVRFDTFDAAPAGSGNRPYYNGWDMKTAMHPQTILAYDFNDQPLTPGHGAPMRVYSPLKLGYKLTKYLTKVTFTNTRPGGYWEDVGYPWLGGV